MYLYRYKIVERVCSSYSHFLELNDEFESESELTEICVGIVEMVVMDKAFVEVMELLVDTELKFRLKRILVGVDDR